MLRNRQIEDEPGIREYLSEGLKFLALLGIAFVVFLFIAAYGCNHDACHVPETWTSVVEFFGLKKSP